MNTLDLHGNTALLYAAFGGHLDVCKFIIERSKEKNPANPRGCTLLHGAALQGDPDLCKLIIDKLEDKNNVHGYTPLHLAANIGNLKVAKLI